MGWKRTGSVLLSVVMLAAACEDSTGGDDTGQLRVFMTSQSTAASEIAANSIGPIATSQIDSMYIRITSISALRTSADTSENSGGWVTVALADSGGKRINLLRLPVAGQDSISLARGELEAGTYKNIRLQFDSAASFIRLKQTLTVGNTTFTAGTSYPLRIPSNVLKTSASFTIAEDSLTSVNLVFNTDASVGNITATGSGQLILSPVIHKR
jgi:hypothetical protein